MEGEESFKIANKAATGAMQGFLIAYALGIDHQYKNLEEMKNEWINV